MAVRQPEHPATEEQSPDGMLTPKFELNQRIQKSVGAAHVDHVVYHYRRRQYCTNTHHFT
jgi:hypothetical protein